MGRAAATDSSASPAGRAAGLSNRYSGDIPGGCAALSICRDRVSLTPLWHAAVARASCGRTPWTTLELRVTRRASVRRRRGARGQGCHRGLGEWHGHRARRRPRPATDPSSGRDGRRGESASRREIRRRTARSARRARIDRPRRFAPTMPVKPDTSASPDARIIVARFPGHHPDPGGGLLARQPGASRPPDLGRVAASGRVGGDRADHLTVAEELADRGELAAAGDAGEAVARQVGKELGHVVAADVAGAVDGAIDLAQPGRGWRQVGALGGEGRRAAVLALSGSHGTCTHFGLLPRLLPGPLLPSTVAADAPACCLRFPATRR